MDLKTAPMPLLRPDGGAVRILVVDDEPDTEYVVSTVLRYQGWQVSSAVDGAGAVAQAERFRPDAVVLDALLPDLDGPAVARRIRALLPEVSILFLTACDVADTAIPTGDAYLVKPVGLAQIVARLTSLLRHAGMRRPDSDCAPAESRLTVADLLMDETAHEVTRNGRLIELSPDEFALLRFLMSNVGQVHTAAQIIEHVWPNAFGNTSRVVGLYITYLRQKIDAAGEPLIHTVPGSGYVLGPGIARPSQSACKATPSSPSTCE
ncbi:response regulator transcription factor [Streptomyces sp. NPDC001843]|uniref:response regulator transcription factor n=1 Tax=Streptomyces sp. NPDC001843 TaxID=3364617 RepID=UPI003680C1BC